ncbi:uncharacterized protein [Watersipora subatra]|uniref:uncharacterized protein n=1 Tax=Watersipora subatra TaxID=2589382 RepID=UPI00355BE1F4
MHANSDGLAWIVPVWISTSESENDEMLVYALVDSASDTTYISDNVMNKLQPNHKVTNLSMTTLTSQNVDIKSCEVKNLLVRGFNDETWHALPTVYSHANIPVKKSEIPTPTNLIQWPHLVKVANSLPSGKMNIPVGLLIGRDFGKAFKPTEILKGNHDNEPFAMKTNIGWLVMGETNSDHRTFATIVDQPVNRSVVAFQCSASTRKDIQKLIDIFDRDFADSDDSSLGMSVDDRQFMEIMQTKIYQDKDKRVVMPLPFKTSPLQQNTKHAAMHRFKMLEIKFARDQIYKQQYIEFMNDIIKKHEATKVHDENDGANDWYIPHFGVYHPKKPDKIRVVFDCAAKVGGVSLNDFLLQGPEHMNCLQGILLRFRKGPVAVMGDIERMFHQFRVLPEHRRFLKFIWYDENTKPATFKMQVHLFGARSSPACATYGLRYLANQYEKENPGSHAPTLIHRNFYVDDALASVDSPKEAIKLIQDTQKLCASGNLRIHKIVSNCREVMEAIPKTEHSSSLQNLNIHTDNLPKERSLGVTWDTEIDAFTFKFDLTLEKPNTRRGVLSTVASLFDPTGFVSPAILNGKLILQEICKSNSAWDTPLEGSILQKWKQWKAQMGHIDQIQIPRCLKPNYLQVVQTAELHTFADASTSGYGLCAYLRLKDKANHVHVSLLASKAKVAPLKSVTVPRLELQAAAGAVRLANKIQEEIDIPDLQKFFFSDSTVTLGYITNTKERYHTYVSNRVQTIRSLSDTNSWFWVPTEENPADLVSRGATPDTLLQSSWLTGPTFLWTEPMVFPSQPQVTLNPNDVEVKKNSTSFATLQNKFSLDKNLERFSQWDNAIKAVATLQKLLNKQPDRDLKQAELAILKLVQQEHFPDEVHMLQSFQPLKRSSALLRLYPFLDNNGILRIGGRLENSTMLSYEEKHPIILPKSAHITTLLIRHFHNLSGHQGREPTLANIRNHGYWIVNAKSKVFQAIRDCITCKKIRGRPCHPIMATLPEERVNESAPFTHCGIDCFGPFIVKDGRKERKMYGLMVTCLSCRAVHIETLEDMTTDCFINALRNVIAIRGHISTIRCDQGTNFVGAFNELFKNPQRSENLNTKFIFNPPHASNMGGVWERQIRSARSILKGLGSKYGGRMSSSQLRTLFYEVMATINSRPLGSVTENEMPLSPNMLLTMKSEITLPSPENFTDADTYSRKRWRVVQSLANMFWRRWKGEYLQSLQQRQKWVRKTPEILVGDIVHVLQDESFRNCWSLGKVEECVRSHDGEVRSLRLRVGSRQYPARAARCIERPVSRVVVLIRTSSK